MGKVQELRHTAYDGHDPKHVASLAKVRNRDTGGRPRRHIVLIIGDRERAQLWRNLKGTAATTTTTKPTTSPPPVPSQEWKELGFQGTDPATDFRGMGIFALHQLEHFSQSPDTRRIYQEAQYGPYWYSFAVIGINASATIVEWLQAGLLDDLLHSHGGGAEDMAGRLALLHTVYAQLMLEFHHKWLQARPANLFAFNDIFAAAKEVLSAALRVARPAI